MAEIARNGRPARGVSIANLALSALAAGALGFLVFAMPEQIFSDLIAGSGLPGFLPAAEPPLGMKARGAVIAAVALLVFALVLLLLRGVDRLSARPARSGADPRPVEDEAEAPRLRRADTHPDAPARRPLLAGRDLGGFADADEYDYPPDAEDDDEMFADLPAQPLPGFLTAGRDEIEIAEEQDFAEAPGEESFVAAEQPAIDEEAGFEEAQAEEEPLVLDTLADEASVEALVSQLPEAGESADNSITSLMHRLETGLVRREETLDAIEPESDPRAEEAPSAPPSWLAPQPVGEDPEPDEAGAADARGAEQYRACVAEGLVSPPPSWLSSEPVAGQPEAAEADEAQEAWSEEIEESEVDAFEPAAPVAASHPPVNEFGEVSWPPPRAEEPQFAPLGAGHRTPSAAPKVQALPPVPVPSAPAEAEAPSEMSIGRRLRSAIADIDKIASSGS